MSPGSGQSVFPSKRASFHQTLYRSTYRLSIGQKTGHRQQVTGHRSPNSKTKSKRLTTKDTKETSSVISRGVLPFFGGRPGETLCLLIRRIHLPPVACHLQPAFISALCGK